ncbi:HNH endonuclease signature motif containing protein [Roseomonas sp. WA12]
MSSGYYGTTAWRRLRAVVLAAQPVCATPGCGLRATDVDHIVQRSQGGADHPSNLRGLCSDCHKQRRQGGQPRARGCDAAGKPNDSGHWWRQEQPTASKSPGAGGIDRPGHKKRVSFRRGGQS